MGLFFSFSDCDTINTNLRSVSFHKFRTLHAEGAQVYECKLDPDKSPSAARTLTWQFREPIAALFADGKSIGRHYAGPNWDHIDGSGVKGKVIASTPGVMPNAVELELLQ